MSLGLSMLQTTQSFGFYKKLKAMDDMNDSEKWAEGSKCYEQL